MGVGHIEGTNSINVGIWSDVGGVPGTELAGKDATGLPTFGTCCATVTVKAAVSLTAGQQYWAVLSTDSKNTNVFAAWNEETTDQPDEENFAENYGSR